MEDREFDEIMNKYVASTGRDAEFDLAKLRQKENAVNRAPLSSPPKIGRAHV